jgi:hypothetical protein
MRVFVFLMAFTSVMAFANGPSGMSDVLHDFACNGSTSSRCHFFKRSLNRDTKKCYPDKYKMDYLPFYFKTQHGKLKNVTGNIIYRGVFPGRYKYSVYLNSRDEITLSANVFFVNKSYYSKEVQSLKSKFEFASKYWTDKNPYQSPIRFVFNIVKEASKAHLKVFLQKDDTRGPYFLRWSSGWSRKTISHELGHLLGLDDEYEGSEKCPKGSIMCTSSSGKPYEYHYYMILRRIICN